MESIKKVYLGKLAFRGGGRVCADVGACGKGFKPRNALTLLIICDVTVQAVCFFIDEMPLIVDVTVSLWKMGDIEERMLL